MVREDDGEDVLTMGCIGHQERAELNCHVGSKSFVAIECCNRVDFCNRNLEPRYTSDDQRAVDPYYVAGSGGGGSSGRLDSKSLSAFHHHRLTAAYRTDIHLLTRQSLTSDPVSTTTTMMRPIDRVRRI